MATYPAADNIEDEFTSVADEIIEFLASRFPVCLSSDEFHYFPQALARDHQWSCWDNFAPESVRELNKKISNWVSSLERMHTSVADEDTIIESSVLLRILQTLHDQLNEVKFHQTQPTFYLTIAAIGLAEALEHGRKAFDERLETMPQFLDHAIENLNCIPDLFRDLGREMILKLRPWLLSLSGQDRRKGASLTALERLEDHLKRIPTISDFRLPSELYERIAADHIGCKLSTEKIRVHLQAEIAETEQILKTEARKKSPDLTWQQLVENLPVPLLSSDGQAGLYGAIISSLAEHCVLHRIAPPELLQHCPVQVRSVPDYLAPVRSTAAYSMPPGYPPAGGTFFISSYEKESGPPRDYRLLTAHETFPGHHLLDASRWSLDRPLRRHIEFPIFYEGWASFSEELLFDTGFFSGDTDRILMAKRRYWRAIRGTIDLDIQTGVRSLTDAAEYLTRAGLDHSQATAMVRRYALKPGYQLCYTIGRRRFKDLYRQYTNRGNSPSEFARQILAQGEIGLDNLEKILLKKVEPVEPVEPVRK